MQADPMEQIWEVREYEDFHEQTQQMIVTAGGRAIYSDAEDMDASLAARICKDHNRALRMTKKGSMEQKWHREGDLIIDEDGNIVGQDIDTEIRDHNRFLLCGEEPPA